MILPYIPHLASLTQHYSPPFRTSEGAAFSTQMRVGIFRTKVDLKKIKWRNRIRSFEGAEYSTQVSAPVASPPPERRFRKVFPFPFFPLPHHLPIRAFYNVFIGAEDANRHAPITPCVPCQHKCAANWGATTKIRTTGAPVRDSKGFTDFRE